VARAALFALVAAGCVGDLIHPAGPAVVYTFDAPLSDTLIDIGDTTAPLACHLRADGRPLECTLEIAASAGGQFLTMFGGRLAVLGLGVTTLQMRPLNVFLPVDTIVRTAVVRSAVPLVRWSDGRTTDTLAVGAMKLLIALPMTRSGAVIAGAPLRLVQDSGTAFAHVVPGLNGWIKADSVGVAVFRTVSDTASSLPRHMVIVPQRLPGGRWRAAPSPTPARP